MMQKPRNLRLATTALAHESNLFPQVIAALPLDSLSAQLMKDIEAKTAHSCILAIGDAKLRKVSFNTEAYYIFPTMLFLNSQTSQAATTLPPPVIPKVLEPSNTCVATTSGHRCARMLPATLTIATSVFG